MKGWAQDMKNIASSMNGKANNMSRWSDPRAEQFRENATMVAKQLKIHLDTFEKMAEFLRKYAQHQEEIEREQRNRMNNLQ